jgi:hypothetical protein
MVAPDYHTGDTIGQNYDNASGGERLYDIYKHNWYPFVYAWSRWGILCRKAKGWCFHHPFKGGRLHVTTQAVGWSLLSLAGVLQISFLLLGLQYQYSYLLHSGSILSGMGQILLFLSLLTF